ncbi:Phosphatidylinositolglycan class N-domain-containing protein [Lanmaoa asiatica]|nr:Phosphatidylinositolglycan class N-domain-containing protein [Lanmaoa asiatica]
MPYSTRHVLELLALGIVFHVVFSSSIFDCYFRNPVIHGMTHHGSNLGESKRLVLIVGDGLRADLLFTPNGAPSNNSAQEVAAPYLRSIVEERGAFGISHTRIPTETRPGHLAMIAGMYEDASEITKVDFDSVFNQSSHTFVFGAPDVLSIFADPSTPGNIRGWSYDMQAADYTKDASVLDTWVLDQFRTLLRNASEDATLNSHLREDKVVFFLHLLGVDTTGHSYRPHSKEYMMNIRVVDGIIREAEKLISDFYEDEETSFIFTADHGMSNIGNHGDGDPDSTRTPLIAWGKGVRGPVPDSLPSSHDDYSRPWQLEHLLRRDVSQADIAPLMASLIGVNWPANSVGVLPDVDPTRAGFLKPHGGEEGFARAALVNTQVLLEHYRIKHELKRANTLFYQPYGPLEGMGESGTLVRIQKLASIEESLKEGQWNEVRLQSVQLIGSCLEGLHYLDTYDCLLIRSIVVIAYIGWAAYTSVSLFPTLDTPPASTARTWLVDAFALSTFLCSATIFWMQNSPGAFYLYIAFPCYLWRQFSLRGAPALVKVISDSQSYFSPRRFLIYAFLVVASLQGMVVRASLHPAGVHGPKFPFQAAYTHRWIWCAGFFIIGVVWPYCTWPSSTLSQNWKLALQWSLSCLVTGVFPLLPVDKKETLSTILFGGTTMLIVGVAYTWQSELGSGFNSRRISASLQMSLLVIIMVVTSGSVLSLQAKNGLPSLNHLTAWTILVISSVYPFISPVRHASPKSKIVSFFLAFSVCFVILSIADEGLFLSAFTCNLLLWIDVEAAVRKPLGVNGSTEKLGRNSYRFQADDVRIALFFLFFTQIAFFGAGNPFSSFFLEPVYRLVTIYNPFLVMVLLIFKILVPYMILSLVLATLSARLRLPPFSLLFVALTLTDGMTLTFFLNVTDTGKKRLPSLFVNSDSLKLCVTGSWFEIGQSINAFCTASLLLVWSTGVCAAGGYLMGDTLVPVKSRDGQEVE